jgi:hypothetical protein
MAMRLLRNGANECWFIDHVLALRAGEKVVDVGCGPADILGECPPSNTWVRTSVNPTSNRHVVVTVSVAFLSPGA